MRDVADEAGVSQASVSYAFNRPSKISVVQRERILAIAKRLGYHGPDAAGRSLRSGHVGAIGVMVMDTLAYAFSDPSNVALLRGIAEVGELADVAVTLIPSPPPQRGEDLASAEIREANAGLRGLVDGVIVHALPERHPAVTAVMSRGIPVVIVDSPKTRGVPFVGVDDVGAARKAAEHLIALGHRRVGILVDRLQPDGMSGTVSQSRLHRSRDLVARNRIAGYLEALVAAGVPAASVPIVEAGGFSRDRYREASHTLLDSHDVTAVLAMSDVLASALMHVASEKGIRVPEDLSVVGFDDAPDSVHLGLTTMHQPLAEKGRVAAQLLLDLIDTGKKRSVTLETEIVVRASTAKVPGRRGATKRSNHGTPSSRSR